MKPKPEQLSLFPSFDVREVLPREARDGFVVEAAKGISITLGGDCEMSCRTCSGNLTKQQNANGQTVISCLICNPKAFA